MEENVNFNSVEFMPLENAAAVAFTDSVSVFREDEDTVPVTIGKYKYIPWGGDNMMPYNILSLIENDETVETCMMFNAEICYGSGLNYNCIAAALNHKQAVEDFFENNDMPAYFLGVAQDFKHYGFAVSVLTLSRDGRQVVRIARREACYCRFEPADNHGRIPGVLYANWRLSSPSEDDVERLPLLNPHCPLADLRERVSGHERVFAMVSRIPTPDHTYYPIPYYAALFKGKWYNIKRLIACAKEAKLKNSAPIKYHVEISDKYWISIFRSEGITDRVKQQERVVKEKENIMRFITGAENAGKVWFSMFYTNPDGKEQHDVVISKVDSSKEGGDWETDIQEAINMVCFTMRVHSNLVGSVPGKSQSNNSGSDKRELYTIAQALQKPYHDILFAVHHLIIAFNGWKGVKPEVPFIMLSTLDEHKDAKTVKI